MKTVILTLVSTLTFGMIPAPLVPQPVSSIDITSSVVSVRSLIEERSNGVTAYAMCTGTMIDPDTVITANHCFANRTDPVVVIDDENITITDVVAHPDNDLALAHLDRSVEGLATWSNVSVTSPDRGHGYHHYGLSGVDTPKKSTVHYLDNEGEAVDPLHTEGMTYGLSYNSRLQPVGGTVMGQGDSGGPFVSDGMVAGVIAAVVYDTNGNPLEARGTMTHEIADWFQANGVSAAK